jgi:hypothetical protein
MDKKIQVLFSGSMADANVKGWKTETRRARGLDEINEQPDAWQLVANTGQYRIFDVIGQNVSRSIKCPYGEPGDILCQRESLVLKEGSWRYAADGSGFVPGIMPYTWPAYQQDHAREIVPAIHMPAWACRFSSTIKEITIERVQDITADGAFAEGIRCEVLPDDDTDTARAKYVPAYRDLWIKLNGADSWERNIWVWVVKY